MNGGSGWSDDLSALTRRIIESGDAMPSGEELCFKNIDGRFATMSLGDYWSGNLRLTDRATKRETLFSDADALLAAGWAVD